MIAHDILTTFNTVPGISKTRLMGYTSISYMKLSENLVILEELGYLESEPRTIANSGRTQKTGWGRKPVMVYVVTVEGIKWMRHVREVFEPFYEAMKNK